MTLDEFIEKTYHERTRSILHRGYKEFDFVFRPRIVCNDGFNISIQASEFHYCTPRITTDSYEAVEAGYPSSEEERLIEYAEDKKNPMNTVYPYVPTWILSEIIESHGGINVEETFKNEKT